MLKSATLSRALFTCSTLWCTVAILACGTRSAAGQSPDEDDVPQVVVDAMNAKYAGVGDIDWKVDRNDSYEAQYELNDIKYRADFDPDGSWIETERSLDWEDLPDAVQDAIKEEYDKDDIVELEYTDNAEKGKFYDVEIDPKGEKKFDVEYRENGTRLSEE